MALKITKKQMLILEFISDFAARHNYSPSYREIMDGVGLTSVSAVAEHINNLVSVGALRKTPGSARSLELVDLTHPETVALFHLALQSATPEEIAILEQAAIILNIKL